MVDPVVEFLNTWTGLALAIFGVLGALYAFYRVVIETIRRLAKTEAQAIVRTELEKHRSLDDVPLIKSVDDRFSRVDERLDKGGDVMGTLQAHAQASVALHRITLLILDKQFPGIAEDLRVNNSDVWKTFIEPYRNGNGDRDEAEDVTDRPERIHRRPRH